MLMTTVLLLNSIIKLDAVTLSCVRWYIMKFRWIALIFFGFLATPFLLSRGKGVCRQLLYLPEMRGKRLQGHVIHSIDVDTAPGCGIECFLEEFCVSYNLGPFQDGKHVCELSDSDAIQHPLDLVPDPAYNYQGTKNACTSSPCPSKANCSSLSETDYRCICPVGYTGIDCETDIDECASNPCDSSANCTNNPGSYECTCQQGFSGDGFTCADIDECASNPCDSSSNCTNNPGSYECTCQPGFIGDGFACAAASGSSCLSIKSSSNNAPNGLYQLSDTSNPSNAYPAHCDMTSFGGGWTMCYTTNDRADPKDETAYDNNLPYGTNGYRTNCNNIEFSDIIFINEDTNQKEYFSRKSGQKIKPIDSYNNNNAAPQGLWDSHGLADASYSYQVMICDNSFYSGFHVSGYTSNCFKRCNSWCSDTASPYFRTASTSSSYSGVAFNKNGHHPNHVTNKLVSVGLR